MKVKQYYPISTIEVLDNFYKVKWECRITKINNHVNNK